MNKRARVIASLTGQSTDKVCFCELDVDETIAEKIVGKLSPSEVEIARALGKDNICFDMYAPVKANFHPGVEGREFRGEGAIKSLAEVETFCLPDPEKSGLFNEARKFNDNKQEFASCARINIGWEPLVLNLGLTGFSFALFDNPLLIEKLAQKYTDWYGYVVSQLADLGFDFVWAADDLAYKNGPIISPIQFREIVLPYMNKVAKKITLPWIFHSDGNILPLIDDLLTLGMNGLHPFEPGAMDIFAIKKQYGHKVTIVGNINVDTLARGTPEQVIEEVKYKLKELAPGGRYIISSSNSITSYMKKENVVAMIKTIAKYNDYSLYV